MWRYRSPNHAASTLANKFGLDICHPVPIQVVVDVLHSCDMEHILGSSPRGTAFLVGNSRKVWNFFVSAFHSKDNGWISSKYETENNIGSSSLDSQKLVQRVGNDENILQQSLNPLETFVESAVNSLFDEKENMMALYSHRKYPGHDGTAKFLPFQRLAHQSGLAYHDSTVHLCLHSVYGPWFALRALVICPNITASDLCTPLVPPSSPLTEDQVLELKNAMKRLMTDPDVKWQDWFAMRRRIASFHAPWPEHEYYRDQVDYHYTGHRKILDRELHSKMEHK